MTDVVERARPWSVEGFRGFWANPSLELVAKARDSMTGDIVGRWPRPIGLVRGAADYMAVLEAVVRAGPDLSLSVPEYVEAGDLRFLRWIGTASVEGRRVSFDGLDRMRIAPDGRVLENYVFCDHPFFDAVAAALARAA